MQVSTPLLDFSEFNEERDVIGNTEMYIHILDSHAPSFPAALEWLRDTRVPVLFHCTGTLTFTYYSRKCVSAYLFMLIS